MQSAFFYKGMMLFTNLISLICTRCQVRSVVHKKNVQVNTPEMNMFMNIVEVNNPHK